MAHVTKLSTITAYNIVSLNKIIDRRELDGENNNKNVKNMKKIVIFYPFFFL